MKAWIDIPVIERTKLIDEVEQLWKSGEYSLEEIGKKVGLTRDRCKVIVMKIWRRDRKTKR